MMPAKKKKTTEDEYKMDPVEKYRLESMLTGYGMALLEKMTPTEQKALLDMFDKRHFN